MKERIVAGDTLDYSTSVPDFPATDGWTLVYQFVPRFTTPTQLPITVTAATYETTDYRVQEGPSTTAVWEPGNYSWYSYVTKSGARQTVGSGLLEIKANPATVAQGTDDRSHAAKTLDAIEAVIEGRASIDQQEYAIAGRSLKRIPIAELLMFRDRYRMAVAREDQANGVPNSYGRDRYVRFARA